MFPIQIQLETWSFKLSWFIMKWIATFRLSTIWGKCTLSIGTHHNDLTLFFRKSHTQVTMFNNLWQTIMEKNMKKNVYTYNWITWLDDRNYHNTVNQLYFNRIFKNPINLHLLSPKPTDTNKYLRQERFILTNCTGILQSLFIVLHG